MKKRKKEKDKGKQTTTTTKATKATKATHTAVVCFCHTTKEHGIVGQKGRAKNKKKSSRHSGKKGSDRSRGLSVFGNVLEKSGKTDKNPTA